MDSNNKNQIGITGKIIDETKNTLLVLTETKRKRVMKENVIVLLQFKDKKVKIKGKLLLGRADERIKKLPAEVR